MNLKVIFDARKALSKTGLGRYCRELLRNLICSYPKDEYIVLSPKLTAPRGCLASLLESKNVTKLVDPCSLSLPLARVDWHDFGVTEPDLAHLGVAEPVEPGDLPICATVHDIAFLKLPQGYPAWMRNRFAVWLGDLCNKARAIIVPSQSTAEDLVALGIAARRVFVIPLAASECFSPAPTPFDIKVLHEYQLDSPFVLFVGANHPRKGLKDLVKAFAMVKEQGVPHKLVIVSPKEWPWSLQLLGTELPGYVLPISYVDDMTLASLYRNAAVFVYPSYYEGFGLPILEAMSSGAPVITCNSPGCSEVGSGAAVLISPGDVELLSRAISMVLQDKSFAEELRTKGLEKARLYSWAATATLTRQVYEFVIGQTR